MSVARSLNVIHRIAPDPEIPRDTVRIAMTVCDAAERSPRFGRGEVGRSPGSGDGKPRNASDA